MIKVAIESCLNIKDTNFLFTQVYRRFVKYGLEQKFIMLLEPFIRSGRFRYEPLPNAVLDRIFEAYKNEQKYK